MDQKAFTAYFTELCAKYSVAENVTVNYLPGMVEVECSKGTFRFVYDFSKFDAADNTQVPMLHWRNKRRYVELKNIIKTKMIENPLSMRVHHIVPRDEFNCSLQNILIQEADMAEFLMDQSVNMIFGDFSGEIYTNCIASTDKNFKVSMELGFSPDGSEPVLLHEIIARRGIASDVVVDTQMQQYPIYVIKGKDITHYNEIDSELYGLDNTQADCIRFMMGVLLNTGCIDGLKERLTHLIKVYEAAKSAGETLTYTKVEM